MIYQTQWGSLNTKVTVNLWNKYLFPNKEVGEEAYYGARADYVDFIKSSKNDTFLFILLKRGDSYFGFLEWVKENDLEDYIVVHTKGITNPVHPDRKHELYLVVMQSLEHFARIQRKEKVE